MIAISARTKVYLARDAADMRKSFRGLITLTEAVLNQEPVSGHLFVFLNRRQDLMKILYWDGTGFCIWYKRLERGTFKISETGRTELSRRDFTLLLEGIEPHRMSRRFWLK